jgi:hypothetical protein
MTVEKGQHPGEEADQAKLGAIRYERGFDVDRMMLQTAERLRAEGVAVAGVVQQAYAPEKGFAAEMNLIDLSDGKVLGISQDLGKHSSGCRLDTSKLAEVEGIVEQALAGGAQLIFVNRFGRAEADGEGLVSAIAQAIVAGVPVLTSVREPFVTPWREFHGGLGSELSPTDKVVRAWCQAATD